MRERLGLVILDDLHEPHARRIPPLVRLAVALGDEIRHAPAALELPGGCLDRGVERLDPVAPGTARPLGANLTEKRNSVPAPERTSLESLTASNRAT